MQLRGTTAFRAGFLPTPIPSFVRPTPTPAPTFLVYVVKAGDNLDRIARRFGTTGRSIQDAARARRRSVRVDGDDVRLAATVETIGGLSAHADRRELAAWLDAIPGVRAVALHHGELEAQRGFAAFYAGRGRP